MRTRIQACLPAWASFPDSWIASTANVSAQTRLNAYESDSRSYRRRLQAFPSRLPPELPDAVDHLDRGPFGKVVVEIN
jgi:hypothetical protein